MKEEKYRIELFLEEGSNNMGCILLLDGKEFIWQEGSDEDKHQFREMLNSFAGLFNRC